MTWYLKSIDLEVWKTISYGYIFPTKDVDGNKIEKPLEEYNDKEKKDFQLNSKAMYILACVMDKTKYKITCECQTAKEVWKRLEITYEGTNQIKYSFDDENEEEVVNMCFMALEDQDEVSSNSNDEECIFEKNELLKFIYKLDENNTLLKKKVFELQKELDEIKENISKVEASKISIKKENEELLKNNEWLVSSLSKFSCGQKAFDMILASQKCVLIKGGLKYKSSKNEKYFKNYFVKEYTNKSP